MFGAGRAVQPPPLPTKVPAERFSEARARETVRLLAEDIGLRVNGTAAHVRAAEALAGKLGQIPGVEVRTQVVSGTRVYRSSRLPAFIYKTINVVARLPGRSPEAILLNAHFDTLTDSVGAADDAAGVAAVVEALRVLAREAPFANTIIVNLNGGEEAGLFGAAGFLEHPFAADVRAYLYLEALPGGRAGLFGAGPDAPWLSQVYARTAPAPLGNIVGQDLVASGLLPHNGDFTPFHEAGLPGLDVAMTGDGWAYHNALDRPARLQAGSLQHMGDTTVAVVRALAGEPLPRGRGGRTVFYDWLGMTMIAYSSSTAHVLAGAALVLVAIALILARRRAGLSLRGAVGALGWTAVAAVAGVLAAVLAGLLLAIALRRPHGWFSAPALVLPAFAAPACAATFAVHALWRRRARRRRSGSSEDEAWTPWVGGLLFWSVALMFASVRGVGAGYLALHWVWAPAVAMIAGLTLSGVAGASRLRAVLLFAGVLPGAVVTIELGVLFLTYFLPITGIIAAPQPFDPVVAALVGIVAAAVGVSACAVIHGIRAGGFGRAALACVAVSIVGVVATAVHDPYTVERPKRLRLAHVLVDDATGSAGRRESALLLGSGDALPLGAVLGAVADFQPVHRAWPAPEAWLPPPSHEFPAAAPMLKGPELQLLQESYDASNDRRELRIRVAAPGAQMRLGIPVERLVAWSLGAPPEAVLAQHGQRWIHLEGLGDEGAELSLTVRGRAPLPLELRAVAREPGRDAVVEAVVRRLPPWTTTTVSTVSLVRRAL